MKNRDEVTPLRGLPTPRAKEPAPMADASEEDSGPKGEITARTMLAQAKDVADKVERHSRSTRKLVAAGATVFSAAAIIVGAIVAFGIRWHETPTKAETHAIAAEEAKAAILPLHVDPGDHDRLTRVEQLVQDLHDWNAPWAKKAGYVKQPAPPTPDGPPSGASPKPGGP